MELQKPKQFRTIGTTVSLALLLGMGSVNAANNGNGNGKSNSPNNNDGVKEYGASVGVSSTCKLDATGMVFQVTTTVTDKSSGDTPALYGEKMSEIFYLGKERGPNKKYLISTTAELTGSTTTVDNPPMENKLDLCAARAGDDPLLRDGTVSLNSLISVQVSNSKGGTTYTSQCVATDDSPKVVIDLSLLDLACAP
jgi:hypothetical protein